MGMGSTRRSDNWRLGRVVQVDIQMTSQVSLGVHRSLVLELQIERIWGRCFAVPIIVVALPTRRGGSLLVMEILPLAGVVVDILMIATIVRWWYIFPVASRGCVIE